MSAGDSISTASVSDRVRWENGEYPVWPRFLRENHEGNNVDSVGMLVADLIDHVFHQVYSESAGLAAGDIERQVGTLFQQRIEEDAAAAYLDAELTASVGTVAHADGAM